LQATAATTCLCYSHFESCVCECVHISAKFFLLLLLILLLDYCREFSAASKVSQEENILRLCCLIESWKLQECYSAFNQQRFHCSLSCSRSLSLDCYSLCILNSSSATIACNQKVNIKTNERERESGAHNKIRFRARN
jgi:hypothetical protein